MGTRKIIFEEPLFSIKYCLRLIFELFLSSCETKRNEHTIRFNSEMSKEEKCLNRLEKLNSLICPLKKKK